MRGRMSKISAHTAGVRRRRGAARPVRASTREARPGNLTCMTARVSPLSLSQLRTVDNGQGRRGQSLTQGAWI